MHCFRIAALFYFTLLLRGLGLVISDLDGLYRVARSLLKLRSLDNVLVEGSMTRLD